MLSARGWMVLGTGAFLWIAARLVGSSTLHIVAVGIVALPVLAWIFVWRNRHHLVATRRLSNTTVPLGGTLTVDIEVENPSSTTTSFVLVRDEVPVSLGRSARLVLTGLPGRNSQRVRYSIPCRSRGRFLIRPLPMSLSD